MKKILAGIILTMMFITSLPVQASEVTYANDQTFSTEIKDGYVLVDFWATWCPPCRVLAPIFDDLSQEFSGQVKFVKLDVDKAPKTSGLYKITAIPTLILFKDGKQIEKWVGGISKEKLRELIKNAL